MLKKKVSYNKEDKVLIVEFPFKNEHVKTLVIIHNNGNETEFENRDPNLAEDVDGNLISWKICDELVEMGLLSEDEESFDVFYEITPEGHEIVKKILEK